MNIGWVDNGNTNENPQYVITHFDITRKQHKSLVDKAYFGSLADTFHESNLMRACLDQNLSLTFFHISHWSWLFWTFNQIGKMSLMNMSNTSPYPLCFLFHRTNYQSISHGLKQWFPQTITQKPEVVMVFSNTFHTFSIAKVFHVQP